jgi:hypothetical protein
MASEMRAAARSPSGRFRARVIEEAGVREEGLLPRASDRANVWVAAVAAAVLIGVHAAARAATLTETDSINLGLALSNYDVRLHQPHPPGYPLVVAAAHSLGWLGEPLQAYLAFAVLASVGAVFSTFLLGRELFDARAGAIAALLLVASPLFLYYASIVSVYPGEMLFGPLVVLIAHRVARRAQDWSAVALAPTLALAGGFRPTMLGLLLPVCILAIGFGRPRVKHLAIGAAIGVAIIAAWAVPMLLESGGVSGYLDAGSLYSRAAHRTSLLHGASLSAARYNALQAIGATVLGAAAAVLLLATGAARRSLQVTGRVRWLLLGAWVLPYLLLYVFVHFGKPGYALAYLPAFSVAAAGAASRDRIAAPLAGLLVVLAVAFFLLVPTFQLPGRLDAYRVPSFIPTADSIRVEDREARALPTIARRCPRSTCTIVSLGTSPELWDHEPWSLSRWYAGGAQVVRLSDLNGAAPPGASVFWVGGDVPAAVANLAHHLRNVGLWQVYETRGNLTRRVESALGLAGGLRASA